VEKCVTAGQATDDSLARRIPFACWINKETITLRVFNFYCFSTETIFARKSLKKCYCHKYIACLLPRNA